MTDLVQIFATLPAPAAVAPPRLDAVLSASGAAFMALHNPHGDRRDIDTLRDGIARAEHLVASATAIGGQLREAVEPESVGQIERQLATFVEAWPNASRGDLAGYGAQLALDVVDRQPCRYALRSALRHLRQSSRFLPSIAEVLTALDDAQARARNTVFHLREIPAQLAQARADLASAEQRGPVPTETRCDGSAR